MSKEINIKLNKPIINKFSEHYLLNHFDAKQAKLINELDSDINWQLLSCLSFILDAIINMNAYCNLVDYKTNEALDNQVIDILNLKGFKIINTRKDRDYLYYEIVF